MKKFLQLGLALLACGASLAGAAADKNACSGLECMVCPALTDPAQYATGNMKLMRDIAPGKDRWLFRSAVDLTNDFGIPAPMRPEFARLMATFAAHGTHVVFAVQPTRGLMHRDKIDPQRAYGFDYAKASASLRAFLGQLRAGGAVVPDVMQLVEHPPQKEYFFRRDHHWTPAGAEATAKVVAEEVRRQPFYASLAKKKYRTEPGVMVPKDGTMNLALGRICGNNYSFQYTRGFQTVPVNDDASALFDEAPDPEVVLVGTSNSASREDESKQFNFDGFLKQDLDVDILNYALPGAGQDGALLEYLQSPNYSVKKPPKMIIWELPANYRLDSPLSYRQLIPAINGGCSAPALAKNKVERTQLKVGDRIELLSNAGEQRKDFTGLDGLLDIKVSDKNVKDFYVIVYYDNGERDKVWFRREAIVTGGQYYLELSRAENFRKANLLSVFMEPTQASAGPASVEVQLCR